MEKLKHKCSDIVAEAVDNEWYHAPLPSQISNIVLESVLRRYTEFPDAKFEKYSSVFRNATKVNWTFGDMSLLATNFLRSLILEELKLPRFVENLKDWSGRDSDSTIQFNIAVIFRRVLSQESCQTLETLSLHGGILNSGKFSLKLNKGWVIQLSGHLINLKHLEVTKCDISAEFSQICTSLRNLTSLNLSATNVTNLSGISNLENLEILNLNETRIRESHDFLELFLLKHLKKLSLVGSESFQSENVRFFFEGINMGMVLSKLEFLNISKNFVAFENLMRLVENHSKLKTIALVGICLNFDEILDPGQNLRIVRSDTVDHLLYAIYFFASEANFCSETLFLALNQLLKLLETFGCSNAFSDDSRRNMMGAINFVMGDHMEKEEIREVTYRLLMILCSDSEHLKVFTPHQRQFLTTHLLSPLYWKGLSPDMASRYISLWKIFLKFEISSLALIKSDLIWDRAAAVVDEFPDPNSIFYQTSIHILQKYMFKISDGKYREYCNNQNWKTKLAQTASGFNIWSSSYFLCFLFVFHRMLNSNEHPIVTDVYLTTLFHNFQTFATKSHYQSEILRAMLTIATNCSFEAIDEFFKEGRSMILFSHIFHKDSHCYRLSISILATLYLRRHGHNEGVADFKEKLVNEIIDACEKNIVTERAQDWATWIFTSSQENNRMHQFLEDVVNPPNQVYYGFYEI